MTGIRSTDAMVMAGISWRQICHWVRSGIVTPSIHTARGSGDQHLFSAEDVALLRTLRRLLDAGARIERLRPLASSIRSALATGDPDAVLIVNDSGAHVVHSADELLAAIRLHEVALVVSDLTVPTHHAGEPAVATSVA